MEVSHTADAMNELLQGISENPWQTSTSDIKHGMFPPAFQKQGQDFTRHEY